MSTIGSFSSKAEFQKFISQEINQAALQRQGVASVTIAGETYNTIYAKDGMTDITGTDGNDVIIGGKNTKSIYGYKGNDFIVTNSQADTVVHGGKGDDYIKAKIAHGDMGNDVIEGFNDNVNNKLWGHEGNDIISGGLQAHNEIYGNQGQDTIIGKNGFGSNDILEGGKDRDSVKSLFDAGLLGKSLFAMNAPTGPFAKTAYDPATADFGFNLGTENFFEKKTDPFRLTSNSTMFGSSGISSGFGGKSYDPFDFTGGNRLFGAGGFGSTYGANSLLSVQNSGFGSRFGNLFGSSGFGSLGSGNMFSNRGMGSSFFSSLF